jgi:hypothetical protein
MLQFNRTVRCVDQRIVSSQLENNAVPNGFENSLKSIDFTRVEAIGKEATINKMDQNGLKWV